VQLSEKLQPILYRNMSSFVLGAFDKEGRGYFMFQGEDDDGALYPLIGLIASIWDRVEMAMILEGVTYEEFIAYLGRAAHAVLQKVRESGSL